MPSEIDGYIALGEDTNKAKDDGLVLPVEGPVQPLEDELTLKKSDEEIIRLTKLWTANWQNYAGAIKKRQDSSEKYWLGQQYHSARYNDQNLEGDDKRPLQDNLIFEALETFLPAATRKNPEPVVFIENSREGQQRASIIKDCLAEMADTQMLRLLLKKQTRFWAVHFLGVIKIAWDSEYDNYCTEVVRTGKIILDPKSHINLDGTTTSYYVGEYCEESAEDLIEKYPKAKTYITEQVNGKMGTKVVYIEWWTRDGELFWTLNDQVLDKKKNPNWNYDDEKITTDEYGGEIIEEVPGHNHFVKPEMPYVFLSYFSLDKQPHDETSLIHQNLSNQDLINKRMRQLVKNADSMNNGIVLSGKHFTREQAAAAAEELANGGALWVPDGDIGASYHRDQAPGLPNDVYNQLRDIRGELRSIFGTTGISPEGIQNTDTARGKILVSGADTSRIGGGITEHIEQVADRIYNYWYQMMLVYWDEAKMAEVVGAEKAALYFQLSHLDNVDTKISVREGSLIPKDSLTSRNEAVELWGAGAIDPETLYEKLDYPDPHEAAEKLFLWQKMPELLFPEAAMRMQQMMAGQMPPGAGPPGAPPGPPLPPPEAGLPPPPESILNQVPLNQ